MIMLGSARDDAWGALVKPPRDRGGATGAVYVVVEDADAHHARAAAAGAEIVEPLEDKEYGGRGYGCRDLEGQVWSFRYVRPVGLTAPPGQHDRVSCAGGDPPRAGARRRPRSARPAPARGAVRADRI